MTRKAKVLYVFLADDEWGNFAMEQVAQVAFHKYPWLDAVHVYKHGGWWLMWDRDLNIVGTANDMARMSEAANEFWRAYPDYEIVATVRRDQPGWEWPELNRRAEREREGVAA